MTARKVQAWLPEEWEAMGTEAMTRIPDDKRDALREAMKHLRGKGWDEASVVLGFSIACGLDLDEALAVAGNTDYPLLGK